MAMSAGKIAAQSCHAALAAYRKAAGTDDCAHCETQGEPVIVLRCRDATELANLIVNAGQHSVHTSPVCDAGRTEVESGTMTCCAFGPGLVERVDLCTGKLRLLK